MTNSPPFVITMHLQEAGTSLLTVKRHGMSLYTEVSIANVQSPFNIFLAKKIHILALTVTNQKTTLAQRHNCVATTSLDRPHIYSYTIICQQI